MRTLRGRRMWRVVVIIVVLACLGTLFAWVLLRKPRKYASLPSPLARLMNDLDEKEPSYSRWMRERAWKARLTNGAYGFGPALWEKAATRTYSNYSSRNHSARIKLCDMGTNAYPAIGVLVSWLQEDDLSTRFNAYNVLCLIHADEDARFAQALHSCTNWTNVLKVFDYMLYPDSTPVIYAQYGLYKLGPEFRYFALRSIAQCGTNAKPLLPKVIGMVSPTFSEFKTRTNAIACLDALGPTASEAAPMLKQIVQNRGEYPQIRAPAIEALSRVAPEDAQTIPLFKEMLMDEHALVRVKAAICLWRCRAISDGDVLPVLEPALEHKLASVRVATLQAICEMGTNAWPLKVKVEKCLADENEAVRTNAKLALSKLGQ